MTHLVQVNYSGFVSHRTEQGIGRESMHAREGKIKFLPISGAAVSVVGKGTLVLDHRREDKGK